MDVRLKSAAVVGWIAGLAATFWVAIDTARWILPLAVGCYAAGACATLCLCMRSVARLNRRAIYHQRRWDDEPGCKVTRLVLVDDQHELRPGGWRAHSN